MINFLLKKIDDFICHHIKNIFETSEQNYKTNNIEINVLQELKNLAYNPFASTSDLSTKFEKEIKMKLKILVAFYFMFLPLVILLGVFHYYHLQFSYAFILAFFITILASARINTIATKYLHFREFISYIN